MTTFGNRLPTAQMSLAFVLANTRYWGTVASRARNQLDRWTRHAVAIPDPALQAVALANLHEEGFNAQATATLATLAPRKDRKLVIDAIVALQVIYDYLDSLIERPLADPLDDGRRLYHALIDAVALDTQPRDDYCTNAPWSNDGGYLKELVSTVRGALTQLPSIDATIEVSKRAAERCAEAQVRAHAIPALGGAQLEQWATCNARGTGLQWREFIAGAVSSGLALHALIATAADPRTTSKQATTIDELYLSICAMTTMLDGLVDYQQDLRDTGQAGYIRFHENRDALLQGLDSVIDQATIGARETPNGPYHLMTLVGIAAYYTSTPTAASALARPVAEQIRQDLKPLITPALTVMRIWRSAKHARTRLDSKWPRGGCSS